MSAPHHYLNLTFAHLQIMLIVDIHPLQCTTHPLICSHEEDNCKATCRIEEETKLNWDSPQRGDKHITIIMINLDGLYKITTIFIIRFIINIYYLSITSL